MQKHVLVKLSSVQQGSDSDFAQSATCVMIPDPLQKLASMSIKNRGGLILANRVSLYHITAMFYVTGQLKIVSLLSSNHSLIEEILSSKIYLFFTRIRKNRK